MRISSGGITIGTITKMISKASRTKALIPITQSTTATAVTSLPGMDETILPTRSVVPSSLKTMVNVVAASNNENNAPVSAIASFQHFIQHHTAQPSGQEASDQQRKSAHRGGLDGIEIAERDPAKKRDQRYQRDGGEP